MEGNDVIDGISPRADTVGNSSAKVPVSIHDTEALMIGKERWDEVMRMKAAGQSVSAIARQTGFDRKTVRGCLRKREWAPYRRKALVETLLAVHQTWLAERAAQVNYSARILFLSRAMQ